MPGNALASNFAGRLAVGAPLGQAAHAAAASVALHALQEAELTASNGDASGGDYFGCKVALSGNTALVGATYKNVNGKSGAGAAYVFVRSGTKWSQQAELTASDGAAGDGLGYSVALSGNTALVDAIYTTVNGQTDVGTVYVYVRSGSSWSQQAELNDPAPAAGERFGQTLALSDDTALIGTPAEEVDGYSHAGVVFAYQRSGASWSEQAVLSAGDAAAGEVFGSSLALAGDTALVGAANKTVGGDVGAGAVYVFSGSGASWSQQTELDDPSPMIADDFGGSVALCGEEALIGTPGKTVDGKQCAGAAYVFSGSGANWTQQAELDDPGAAKIDSFGGSVALSGDVALIGASGTTVAGKTGTGIAYVFSGSGASWSGPTDLGHSGASAADSFGNSVALSGDIALIGAQSKATEPTKPEEGVVYTELVFRSPNLSLKAASHTLRVGKSLTVSGVVAKAVAGYKTVQIWRKVGSQLKLLKQVTISGSGAFKAQLKTTKAGKWVLCASYKVVTTKFSSKAVTVTVHA